MSGSGESGGVGGHMAVHSCGRGEAAMLLSCVRGYEHWCGKESNLGSELLFRHCCGDHVQSAVNLRLVHFSFIAPQCLCDELARIPTGCGGRRWHTRRCACARD